MWQYSVKYSGGGVVVENETVVCAACYSSYNKSQSVKCPACLSGETVMSAAAPKIVESTPDISPLPQHYVITGVTKNLNKLQLFGMRAAMRKRGATEQMIEDFLRDIESGVPRHEIYLREHGPFQTPNQLQNFLS